LLNKKIRVRKSNLRVLPKKGIILLGQAVTLDTIKQCLEEYGFLGIKFNGAQDDYVIDDPDIGLPSIETAAQYGKPIAFHIGADFYENTHPYRLGHITATFPEPQFLMVHMGGASLPALDRSAIEVAARHSNIAIIGSAIPARAILRAIHTLEVDRLCFGSDTPFGLMHVELAKYKALLQDFNEVDQARVLGGNLCRLLSLPKE
jgi:predicted TIM-barrel fold metal-dependent hydrolase